MATEKNFKVDTGVTTPSIATATGDFQWSANVTDMISNSGPTETIVNLDRPLFGDPYSGQITIQDVAQPSELNGTWYYQATNPAEVALYTDQALTIPVDSSSWQPYTSGGFVYTVGYTELVINASSVSITSEKGDAGTYLWNFGIDGNLSVPGNIIVSQSIVSSPSPYINGFSSANFGLHVTAGEVRLSNNAVGTDGGTSNLVLNAQHGFATDSYIQLPTFADGGEKLTIKNEYASGNGIDVITGGGTWFFDDGGNLNIPGSIVFPDTSIYISNGYTISSTQDIGGQVDYNNHTIGYSADNNGTAALYARDSAGLGNNNAVVSANAVNGKVTLLAANTTTSQSWVFDGAGNLTLPGNTFSVNYANGSAVPLGGGGGSYGDSNVVTLLSSYGSNSISTTGNVFAGAGRFTGSFLEADATTAGMFMGYAGGTPRVMFATGTTGQTFEIDNDGGNLRFYQPGSTKATLTSGGDFSVSGNVTATNIGNISAINLTGSTSNVLYGNGVFAAVSAPTTIANVNSNIAIATANGNVVTTVNSAAIFTVYSGGIKVAGSGILQSPGGATSITLNNNGANLPTANVTTWLNVTGSNGAAILGTATTGIGALNVGNTVTQLANTVASFTSNVNNYTQVTNQNKNTGTDATSDYILTADNGSDTVNYGDFGIINSGYDNGTPTNSLGNIVFAADTYVYAQGNTANASQSGGNLAIGTTVPGKNVKIFAGGVDNTAIVANIANTGITITGNLSVSGNISGNTGGFAIGYRDIPQLAASNTTLAATDGGKHYYSTTAGNFTLTVPNSATTTFATGTAISIVVQAAGNILVNAAAGVTLYMAGNSTAANRVVGGYGMATLMKVGTDTWFINGTGVS